MPFALLAAAQLLAVAAGLGLAAAALRPPLRNAAGFPRVLALGGVGLAVVDATSAARLGSGTSALFVSAHAAGLLVIAVGLAFPTRAQASSGSLAVAPLGAALPWSVSAAIAGLVAALAAATRRQLPGRWLLSGGLLVQGAALLAAPAARMSSLPADGLLVARALGGALVLSALAELARTSVLAKVVTALGLGVLATAVATAGVVGTVVADQLSADQERQLQQAATGAAADLQAEATAAQQLATLAAGCATAAAIVERCAGSVARFATGNGFAAIASPGRGARVVGGDTRLDTAALLDLRGQPAVRQALADPAFVGSGFVLLRGNPERLVALGVASHRDSTRPSAAPAVVVVYGTVVDPARLAAIRARSTFDATVLSLPDGTPLASSLGRSAAAGLAVRARTVLPRLSAGTALARLGEGNTPTTGYVLLPSGTDRVAALALSARTDTVLSTQRTVLELLFVALVLIGLAVSGAAYVLGRRAVAPVLRLTVAARAVGAGDLSVRPEPAGHDEVGQLAEVFGAMTGSLRALTGDLRDTAEREAATGARLATVLDAMGDALVVADAEGMVYVANPAAAALLGPCVGHPITSVLVTPGGAALGPGDGVVEGAFGPVSVAVSRAALPDGRGEVYVIRDITARRQLELAKTEFLANVSHELRTPLTPIQGYAEMLRRRPDLPSAQIGAMATEIAASSRRMARVVGLLVDVAALDAGRVDPQPRRLPATAFLDARLADWRDRRPARAADLRRRVSAGTPPLLADPVWLARALDELVDNAMTFTTGGPVTLLAGPSARPGRVRVGVRDAGVGLDAAAKAALFDDFRQADGSATRSHDGLGLGLAFVRRVAVLLDADLQVGSEPGAGATFTLELPAAPVSARAASVSA